MKSKQLTIISNKRQQFVVRLHSLQIVFTDNYYNRI